MTLAKAKMSNGEKRFKAQEAKFGFSNTFEKESSFEKNEVEINIGEKL